MKADLWLSLLGRFHGKRLLLDTNLLFPYLMGCFYRVRLQVPRYGSLLSEEEFELLAQIIEHFRKVGQVVTTPHLLTEVSNLSKKGLKENRVAFLSFIGPLIRQLDEKFDEGRIGAHRLVWSGMFSDVWTGRRGNHEQTQPTGPRGRRPTDHSQTQPR